MRIVFPDPRTADENGIVWMGGDPTVENLCSAYDQGIFPWPHEGLPLLWFSPPARGILPIDPLHVPRSFVKTLKKNSFRVTFDQAFSAVMDQCARTSRGGQSGTWITSEMKKNYHQMHVLGFAHSVECWSGDRLVGGLYGVFRKGVFSGESMFHHVSGASKMCLVAVSERLRENGHEWFDIQMVTPVLELFGGVYLPRHKYLTLLKETQATDRRF